VNGLSSRPIRFLGIAVRLVRKRPVTGSVGVRRGVIGPPRTGNSSVVSRAGVTGNGSGGLSKPTSRQRQRTSARASAMKIFQKILAARHAGVRVVMSCSSRRRVRRCSVSVVPHAVKLYGACASVKRAGDAGVG